jgi:hypothetical protein
LRTVWAVRAMPDVIASSTLVSDVPTTSVTL